MSAVGDGKVGPVEGLLPSGNVAVHYGCRGASQQKGAASMERGELAITSLQC